MDDILSPQQPDSWPTRPYETKDPSATRGVVPTLIRSLAVHLTSAASFGHLLSLRNATDGKSTILLVHIMAVLIFPLLPLVQLLRQLRFAMVLCLRKRRLDYRLSLSVICGMKAITSDGSDKPKPLAEIDRNCLRWTRASYNCLWLGRVAMLLALMAQYIGTILLWCRRASRASYVRVWQIDTRNLEMALGGLITVIFSLVISFLNTQWKEENEAPYDNVSLSVIGQRSPHSRPQNAISAVDTFGHDLHVREAGQQSWPAHASSRPNRPLAQVLQIYKSAKELYVWFRALNARISNATTRIYPSDLQWDVELAYMLKVFISITIIPFDSANPVVFHNLSNSFTAYLLYSRFIDAFYHAGYLPSKRPKTSDLIVVLYLLPFVIILTHNLLWIIARSPMRRISPDSVQKMAAEVDFWFRKGRTCLSIPLSLLMLLPFYFQILFTVYDFEAIKLFQSYMFTMGWGDLGNLWNDPLAESLYIF